MNDAHLHLILNHLPVVGSIFSLGLLLFSFLKNSFDLKTAAYGMYVATAITGCAAFYTGEGAEKIVKKINGISEEALEEHEEAGEFGLYASIIPGLFSLGVLVTTRRKKRIPKWADRSALLLGVWMFAVMTRVAFLGGQIHHPEANSNFEPNADLYSTPTTPAEPDAEMQNDVETDEEPEE